MIAVYLLPRERWEDELRKRGCKPLEGKGPLNTAEWWITPWKFVFTVPVEGPDGRCDQITFWAVLADVEASRKD